MTAERRLHRTRNTHRKGFRENDAREEPEIPRQIQEETAGKMQCVKPTPRNLEPRSSVHPY